MEEKAKSDSILDAIPDWIWWILGGASGFIAGHAISAQGPGIRVTVQSRRMVVVTVGLLLGVVFTLSRRKFPGFGNVALWCGTFCLGLIRW